MSKAKFKIGRSSNNLGIFKDTEMDWFFKRTLAYAGSGGADIGDCLSVVDEIKEKDIETWINAWEKLGTRVEQEGDLSLKRGHNISARSAYLRASNYYRAAEYAAVPTHPKFHDLWRRSRESFHKACPLFKPAIQIMKVSFEGKDLPAYFWAPDSSDKKRPTMFSVGGNDSSGEKVWHWNAKAAIERGYNFFTFEFPGHRGTVHLFPDCVKRHDMEKPFSAAFDVLEQIKGVDSRIALAGHSFGGYVVSRVAVFEKRVAALIPSTPLIDINRAQRAMLTKSKLPLFLLAWLTELKMRQSPLTKSMMYLAMWNSGYAGQYSARQVFNAVLAEDPDKWCLRRKMHHITCPTLALAGENEGQELIDQTCEFYETISSKKKKLYIFSMADDGSDDHCQLDNRLSANRVIFDWLDELFKFQGQP